MTEQSPTGSDPTATGLVERIATLERFVRENAARLDELEGDDGADAAASVGRRSLLRAAGAAGLLTLGAGRAAADPQGRVGSAADPARAVYTMRLGGGVTGGTVVEDLLGPGLTTERVDGATSLSAAPAAPDIVNDFGTTFSNVRRVELAGALSAEENPDGGVTLAADDDAFPPAWEDTDGDDLLEPRESSVSGVGGVGRIENTGGIRIEGGTAEQPRAAVVVGAGDTALFADDEAGAVGGFSSESPYGMEYRNGFAHVGPIARTESSADETIRQGEPYVRLTTDGIVIRGGRPTAEEPNVVNVGGDLELGLPDGTATPALGAIRLANADRINWYDSASSAVGGVTLDTGDRLRLDTPDRTTDEVTLSAPDTGNVAPADLGTSELAFALDEANGDVDVVLKQSDGTTATAQIASYSTARLKTDVRPFDGDPTDALDVAPALYTAGDGAGEERLGLIAERAHDAGLEHLVRYAPVEDAWQSADGIDDAYVEAYGVERDGETLVPNDIDERAWLAMHHELLRDLVAGRAEESSDGPGAGPVDGGETTEESTGSDDRESESKRDDAGGPGSERPEQGQSSAGGPDRVSALEAEVDTLRDELSAVREENDRLRAENERLRERLAAVEERLDIDADPGGRRATEAD